VPPTREELVLLTQQPDLFLAHADPVLRRMAVTALSTDQAVANFAVLKDRAADKEVAVRTATADKLGFCGDAAIRVLRGMADDAEPNVREAVATAFGEVGSPEVLEWLTFAATNDTDRHVREAAVATLGAIGDDRAIETLLGVMKQGPPQVRRRAIAAITVFNDDRIEPAIRRAALDRNPGVREAAEMVVGRQLAAISPSEGTGELASHGDLQGCEPQQDC